MNRKMFGIVLMLVVATMCHKGSFLDENFVNELRKKAKYEVHDPSTNPFNGYTEEQIKKMLGLLGLRDAPKPSITLPTEYDFRKEHPNCVVPPENQDKCEAYYTITTSHVLSMRQCLKTNNLIRLSSQDGISCDTKSSQCNGSFINRHFNYLKTYGIVTDECFPFQSGNRQVPECPTQCVDSSIPFKKYKVENTSQIRGAQKIKEEIYNNGPVITSMSVYADLENYTGGIYEHTHGSLLRGTLVTIVGWGVSNGNNYWIVQNNWGDSWGEKGYFRIKEGAAGIALSAYVLDLEEEE